MSITKFKTVSVKSGETQPVNFGTSVIHASVAVQGYSVTYGSTDHHVRTLEVKASMKDISGSEVTVSSTCTMEDDSSHRQEGSVDVLVIAVCES
ncbi:hypothetical protein [Photobacterium alginatilyticum]|uniref:Uncharacterized protein n=1 Tax=Photobacterium alginatilyticum TaxID=1775171 RepID=A0ABW9YDZ5_9GAMM|nr:hypothetical protein [Photobacterium alginatilyticum]NBI51881.1 hypothetical protein [Photobacterium alginatilyticum]